MNLLPESTYRLQFHKGFTFRDATAIVPYLAKLGITHVYASPYLKATPGSMHGYDVTDHCKLNPDIGSEADRAQWVSALAAHGMSHILDIVPNHVGVATNENVWWNDVLEYGPASCYAKYFDISWNASPRPDLQGRVLLPVLGKPYGKALEDGELRLNYANGSFSLHYYERTFPISRRSWLNEMTAEDCAPFNGTPGNPQSFDLLDQLLAQQFYRLAYWRVASDEINYRRFFDINDLAALRMELPEVFEATHRLIMQWLADGSVQGLRIDHPDGLYDPRQYLQRLQQAYLQATSQSDSLYVVVEKILAAGESLPPDWPVSGTSGYDFLSMTNGLFVRRDAEDQMSRIYNKYLGQTIDYDDLIYGKKRAVLEDAFASEFHMLTHRLAELAQKDRSARDFTFEGLRLALREVIACFGVYRTYMSAGGIADSDCKHVERALKCAQRRNSQVEPAIFDFIRGMLLLDPVRFFDEADRDRQLQFAGKFQQLTAPVTAKGIEDTSFYIYNRFISINEVGSDPSRFGIEADELHAYFQDRQQRWPQALSPLSTHDTKRSEDVRARLNVLSEMPDEWEQHVALWSRLNAPHRVKIEDQPAPDPNDEYLLYQTILGARPLEEDDDRQREHFIERIKAYMQKAVREAKVHTSWTRPNESYESAVASFVERILDPQISPAFFEDFLPFQHRISHFGMLNSLSQSLVRLTAPGVPDTYQGTELWDFSLVDPDNRRPVDYAVRSKMLDELVKQYESANDRPGFCRELARSWRDGRIKMFQIRQCLSLRKEHRGLFSEGAYTPLKASGQYQDNVFSFMRRSGEQIAIVVTPRFQSQVQSWADTTLLIPKADADRDCANAFTSTRINLENKLRLSQLLADFPVALLISS